MIFGVLGIIDPSHQLQVDYHLTVEEVYTAAFQNMLQSERSLNVLRFVSGGVLQDESNRSPISQVELPSWVPDLCFWNTYSTAVTIQTKGIVTNLAGNHYIYAASGKCDLESKTEFAFEDDGRTLVLTGLEVAIISETGELAPTAGESVLKSSSIIDVLPGWKSLARLHESTLGQKRHDMF